MASGPQDEDEVEDCVQLVRPSDNVYSFFMFVGPTESKKIGLHAFSWDIVMAYFLVALNFFMQGVLVYLIYESVVTENISWQNGVVKVGGHGVGLFQEAPTSSCNDGGSLCFRDGATYSCAPPSIQLTGRWGELDTNGDGIWTREEVEKAKEELQCKYVVNPVEVFDVLVNMLKLRKDIIWVHPDIESGKAIHFPYFTYAMGDLIMCGYRSHDMCANLLQRGFFHEALKTGKAPRVGTTIESALAYCKGLLQPGGTCEALLPSTYTVWKISSGIECGSPEYDKFSYTNPGNGQTKSLLEVNYSMPAEYELAQEFWFGVYKSIILYLWLLLMYAELKEILKIVSIVLYFPDADDFGDNAVIMEQDPADPEDVRFRIQGIESEHRMTMGILTVLRTILTLGLMACGVSYIVKTNGYADLLMNGVTLAFVAELAAILYAQVLREEIRDQCSDIKPMKVKAVGIDWLNRRPALADMFACVALAVIVYAFMEWQMQNVVLPVFDSLTCTCSQVGKECLEAQKFNYDFWNHYWGVAVPGVFNEVSKLKAGAPGAAMMFANTSSHPSIHEMYHAENLEMRMQQMKAQHDSLEKEIDALEQDWEARLASKSQPAATGTVTSNPVLHLHPKSSTPLEDDSAKASYKGSIKKFGSSLLEKKKRMSGVAL